MVAIPRADSPIAQCRVCGVGQQFHKASDIPHSADRDHPFEAETIADFEPSDLNVEQLVSEIFAHPNQPRAVACGKELHKRVRLELGVDVQDLIEVLS